eukprot:jgi/Chlat1/6634/Chrsp482S06112
MEEAQESTLFVCREVHVYRIPPRASSGGYKVAEWLASSKIWSGRLRVLSAGEKCIIRLEDSNTSELFAECPILSGQRDRVVESATDSSRYFVLRIQDPSGRHAFIGIGFNERNEAFDFNVALSDHDKYLQREKDAPAELSKPITEDAPPVPAISELKLKEGQTISINVKTGKPSGGGFLSKATAGKAMPLAPPPPPGRMPVPVPPPPPPGRTAAPTSSFAPPPTTSRPTSARPQPPQNSGAAASTSGSDAAAQLFAAFGAPAPPVTQQRALAYSSQQAPPPRPPPPKPASSSVLNPLADLSSLSSALPAGSSKPASTSSSNTGWASFN